MSLVLTTDTDVRRWQREHVGQLLSVLALGQRYGLAPIDWTVPATGPLHGRCLGLPAADRRRVWQGWTDALSGETSPERSGPPGVVYLRSVVRDPRWPRLLRVVLTASWEPDDIGPDGDDVPGTWLA